MARLSHPGIARLLDGGVTPEGRPFLFLNMLKGGRSTSSVRKRSWTRPPH